MRTLINGVTAITLDEDNRILPHINIAHPPPGKASSGMATPLLAGLIILTGVLLLILLAVSKKEINHKSFILIPQGIT